MTMNFEANPFQRAFFIVAGIKCNDVDPKLLFLDRVVDPNPQ
jgi:hypothetical protein